MEEQLLIREPELLRVELVEHLPAACGGGVVVPDEESDLLWLLLEPPGDAIAPSTTDLVCWSEVCYALLEQGEMVTCADQARRFGVAVDVAQAAFWVAAWEWAERALLATLD